MYYFKNSPKILKSKFPKSVPQSFCILAHTSYVPSQRKTAEVAIWKKKFDDIQTSIQTDISHLGLYIFSSAGCKKQWNYCKELLAWLWHNIQQMETHGFQTYIIVYMQAHNLPPWQQNIFSSIIAAIGKQLKQSVNVFHSRMLNRRLPESDIYKQEMKYNVQVSYYITYIFQKWQYQRLC